MFSWNDQRLFGLVTSHGADLQALDIRGETALHYAVRAGRVKAMKLLLEKGAVVNVADNIGRTPLLIATRCSAKADEIVPLLMKHGADVTVRDIFGHNALHCLAFAPVEHADLAKVLIEKGASLDGKTTFDSQFQPIHMAAKKGKNELLKVYLDHGVNVNAQAAKGESPLFIAATCKNPAVLLTLLKRGANIELKTSDGRTALYEACDNTVREKDNRENIKILLPVGADMCVENNAGKTALANVIAHARTENRQLSNIGLMLRTLALRKACLTQPSIELVRGEGMIQPYPEIRTYYQKCVKHIHEAKSMRLINTCTLFDLLAKCPCQIAALMHDRQLEKKFKLFDLKVFLFTYADDIREAFESAKLRHEATLKQEDVINEAVHNILPWMIVRKVARYTVDCEQCELKRIVQASRKICPE